MDRIACTIWYMRFEQKVTIQAPADRVWQIYSDAARWPEWNPTIDSLEVLGDGPLRVGLRARIRQPKLPAAVWEVTELVDGEYFEWVATGPGIRTTGGHRVRSTPEGTVATATVIQEGPLGRLFGRLTGKLTRRYLELEAESLKKVSEQG